MILSASLFGQDKMYKEIKTLKKEASYKKGGKILIKGERTFLVVKSWKKNHIQANIKVISRHVDQKQAKTDLEKINIVFEKKGKTLFYSNAIQVASAKDKPKSNLKVSLELFVPENALLEIENQFGKIEVEGVFNSVVSKSNFSKLLIHDFSGKAVLNTKYGDTNILQFDGPLSITADRSNLTLKDINGSLNLNIKYGELDLYYNENVGNQRIEGKYAPIKIHLPSDLRQDITLECHKCNILSNDKEQLSTEKKEGEIATAIIKHKTANHIGTIKSEFEDITIIFETAISKRN